MRIAADDLSCLDQRADDLFNKEGITVRLLHDYFQDVARESL